MDERLTELTIRSLVERLASSDPVPGGGSASALAGAMGAALVHMVVELTVDRPAAAGQEETLSGIRTAADWWQSELLDLAELDAKAYAAVVIARRPAEGVGAGTRGPRRGACRRDSRGDPRSARHGQGGLGGARAGRRLAPIGNRNAISDVGVAALLAVTAVRGAALNVEINLPSVTADEELRGEAASEIERLLAGLDERERTVRDAVAERLR